MYAFAFILLQVYAQNLEPAGLAACGPLPQAQNMALIEALDVLEPATVVDERPATDFMFDYTLHSERGFSCLSLTEDDETRTKFKGLVQHASNDDALLWVNIDLNLCENATVMASATEFDVMDDVINHVKQLLDEICKRDRQGKWVGQAMFLSSEFESKTSRGKVLDNAQKPHKDFDVGAGLGMAASALVTFAGESRLLVLPGSQLMSDQQLEEFAANEANWVMLIIPPWHILVFNSQLVHAGAVFFEGGTDPIPNTRLFLPRFTSHDSNFLFGMNIPQAFKVNRSNSSPCKEQSAANVKCRSAAATASTATGGTDSSSGSGSGSGSGNGGGRSSGNGGGKSNGSGSGGASKEVDIRTSRGQWVKVCVCVCVCERLCVRVSC